MRKRRRWSTLFIIIGLTISLAILVYFATISKLSYVVQLGRPDTNFSHSINEKSSPFLSTQNDCSNCKKPILPDCQDLDVAVVSAGYESTARVSTLVKAILYHRGQHPLNFHFLVDNISRGIIRRLFDTWQLPAVNVFLYDTENINGQIDWIPNKHYSGNFGLMKLTLPDILPPSLKKILVLDTDILIVSDVAEIWRFWQEMSKTQAICLVENLSDWYLIGGEHIDQSIRWPALGRGYNTGVMLMDLEKLRYLNWSKLWREIATFWLKKLGQTQLADQDIINAVIKRLPHLVFRLPCEWNLQMGFRSLPDMCSAKVNDFKIIHWNSPVKTKSRNKYADFFRKHYQMFVEMDGSLLRNDLLRCDNLSSGNQQTNYSDYELNVDDDAEEDGCDELRRARFKIYRTHLFIREYNRSAKTDRITLVTQLSIDRLVIFERLVSHWPGPVSAAFYLSDSEANLVLNFAAESQVLSQRTNVGYHIVYKEGPYYPVNYLRNVALNASKTQFVLLSDVDLLPSSGLYDTLERTARINWYHLHKSGQQKLALIIAAFETFGYKTPVARDKQQLIGQLQTGKAATFRQDVWPQGHMATDYDKWIATDSMYEVNWQPDYEPYLVLSKRYAPVFDQRFVGFGWNKVSYVMRLNSEGYKFLVVPNEFLVHQPHSASFSIGHYRSSRDQRQCLKAIRGEFIRDLAKIKNSQFKFSAKTATNSSKLLK